MQNSSLRYPGCKWNKHLVLLETPSLQPYLPQTDLFNKESFIKYIHKFPVIFLKPSLGGGGYGVYKITKHGNRFCLHSNIYKKMYMNKARLFYDLQHKCSRRKYIIQQGLELMRFRDRLVDFRIVLLKPQSSWEFMGIMGKISAKSKFVTNQARGGKPIQLNYALREGLNYSEKECEQLMGELQSLSLNIAKTLNKTFYNISEMGIDIAVDQNKKIWILEVNTKPHFKLFKHHEDNTLYSEIMKHIKHLRSLPN